MSTNTLGRAVRSPLAAGAFGMLGMAGLYAAVVVFFSGSAAHAWEQFLRYRWWMLATFIGFGVQTGIMRLLAVRRRPAMGPAAAAGGTGTVAMAACCAHHVADFFPFWGGTLLAGLVVRAQIPLLAVGAAANLAGIAVLLGRLWGISWRQLAVRSRAFVPRSWAPVVYAGSGVLAVVVAAATLGWLTIAGAPTGSFAAKPAFDRWPARRDVQAAVEVTVAPLAMDQAGVRFSVALETHTVDLDYDFAALSMLTVDGRSLAALRWEGGRGGHHLSGALVFPPLPRNARAVVLEISGIGGVVRRFDWSVSP